MNRLERLNVSARVFGIAAIVGLSLALFDAAVIRGTLLLAAISATAIAATVGSRLPVFVIALVESGFAALVVGVGLPDGLVLLPYLVVPALIVGLISGARAVLWVVGVETVALALVLLTEGPGPTLEGLATILLPWLTTSLGIGLMAAWLKELRIATGGKEDINYESARRLLTQLRTVARRLSAGLDPISMSAHLLETVHREVADTHSAVFVKSEGGVLMPLAYRGATAQGTLTGQGDLVDRCWADTVPCQAAQTSGISERRNRLVLPLRVAGRMIGVVMADTALPVSKGALDAVMQEVDEHALRLDTALVFDEVRSLATAEERQRLAREIHDGVAQEIASLGYVVDDLLASAGSDGQRRKLVSLRSELSRVVGELRLSIFDLRSEVASSLGSALSEHVRQVGSRSPLTVHLTLDEAPTRLRPDVEVELLRIAQEAITNARKHSQAGNLWVDCRVRPPFARIEIKDDGQGLGPGRADSYGLRIMRERAERIGARLEVSDGENVDPALGTVVTITVGSDLDDRVSVASDREAARP
ncbi:MAG TPA: histidine kinase [Nocardioidaceae bacterium]|nr:histidine kinase [Nocardioidaceae bacterium]